MEKYSTLLEEALEAWYHARMGVISELENIPEEQWKFHPAKETRTVRELAIHILEVAMMMTGELTRTDTNFRRFPWPKLLGTYAGPAYQLQERKETLNFLQSQFDEAIRKFRDAGELHMLQFIQRFDGKQGTRLAWLYHGIAQEEYHRGQLTVYARLMGLEPALTKLIKGE
jgi:uncharacterized damage-inducible protein DinB